MRLDLLTAALPIMLIGYPGIFLVMVVIILAVKLLMKLHKH